jgi:glycogen debranching enzyme
VPFKVQVGPPQIAIHQGQTVLVTDPDGQIGQPSDKGLYFFDTRVISHWTIYANGEPWELLNGGPTIYCAAGIFLTNRAFLTQDGPVPPRTLGLVLGRSLSGGLHEDLDLTNHGARPVRFQLEISLRSDFADIFEVKANRIARRGRITTTWSEERQELTTVYRHADFCRAVRITTSLEPPQAVYANGRLSFEIALAPAASWHCCLFYELHDGERRFAAPPHCVEGAEASQHAEALADWQRTVLKIQTSNEEFYRLYHQAVEDMAALRLPIGDTGHLAFLPAAGLPWFVAPFGRDSLIVSLQNLLVYPDFAKGALEILGSLQARELDDYRDAEPGKILHEIRYGELAHFKLIPHTPYYGTADATPLYLITLYATWLCTGERDLLLRHLDTAERCLRWIDEYGDRDGDGFQEYQTRSPAGYENMGWKDAGDALVHPDGTLVKGPKALCELQGYVYAAWLRMAEVYDVLDRPSDARLLREKAAVLFRNFNDAFWDEETGFYAFALDGEKRKVLSVASNVGHCLWSGIIPVQRAQRVVARLMQPDMWSGWGIRTLSARHPAFNPYNYQTGSVWPHDNGIIALGFRRYGFAREAAQVARDVSRAAGHFLLNQLPELYAGIQRGGRNFPVQYLGANVPQAWAAGAAFMLMQAMLGFQPDGPRNRLFVDPYLPSWLPDLTVHDLRIGQAVFDIRFWREGETTAFEVLKGDARAVIRRDMTATREFGIANLTGGQLADVGERSGIM